MINPRSRFITPLDYRDLNGDLWLLRGTLQFYSARLGGVWSVEKNKLTDLASIPRLLHRLLPKSGPHNYGAVVHDDGYELNGKKMIYLVNPYGPLRKAQRQQLAAAGLVRHLELNRGEVDALFTEAMRAPKPMIVVKAMINATGSAASLDVPDWARRTMYAGVLLGGWMAWNAHARRIAAGQTRHEVLMAGEKAATLNTEV